MRSKLVKKIAKAIGKADNDHNGLLSIRWRDEDPTDQGSYLAQADAALKALAKVIDSWPEGNGGDRDVPAALIDLLSGTGEYGE